MLSSVMLVTVIGKVLGLAQIQCPSHHPCGACNRCWEGFAQKDLLVPGHEPCRDEHCSYDPAYAPPLPYYPPLNDTCLSPEDPDLNIPGSQCMDEDQAKKACDAYYKDDKTCAGFWYDKSANCTRAHYTLTTKQWCGTHDNIRKYLLFDSYDDGKNWTQKKCEELCDVDVRCSFYAVGFDDNLRMNQCATFKACTEWLTDNRTNLYAKGGKGYTMHFKSKFVPEKTTSKCLPSVQNGHGGNLGQGDAPVSPEAVQAKYQFSPGHTFTGDLPHERGHYWDAFEKCETDDKCKGYTWQDPVKHMYPMKGEVDFKFASSKEDPQPGNPTKPPMNVLVKQSPITQAKATEAPISV